MDQLVLKCNEIFERNTYLVDVSEYILDPSGKSTKAAFPGKSGLKIIFRKRQIIVLGGHAVRYYEASFDIENVHSIE
jgi:hypothetical protein